MNNLDQLKQMTTVVADTGDIDAIESYTPTDATTNPSLLYKAAQQAKYKSLLDDAIGYAKGQSNDLEKQARDMMDKLAVNFGARILDIVPGRVSTEVDARLSFDTEATIHRAEHLIKIYQEQDIDPQRILIKIASTWEGIRAAEQLESRGIHCNLTLMFSLTQAVASAEAGVTLISPFVGRIMDWYKQSEGVAGYTPEDDPGVKSVTAIYNYYKHHGYATVVMGASFRNTDEILQLAGCDYLTISPNLMEELRGSAHEVARRLDPANAKGLDIPRLNVDESNFRWNMNEDPMATEKLAEGIRNFTKDTLKLEAFACQACEGHV